MQETESSKYIEIIHEGEEPAYSDDGVDLTLIRWMLSLTPLERLLHLQDTIDSIRIMRGELEPED